MGWNRKRCPENISLIVKVSNNAYNSTQDQLGGPQKVRIEEGTS